jgi:hypothetical protein
VQKAVEDAFKASGFNGASVVLDPSNGDVLAFTSVPAYDPNAFAAGVDRATWAALNTDEDRPLNDRAIQGRYLQGSTVKLAVALAGIAEEIITQIMAHRAGRELRGAISSAGRRAAMVRSMRRDQQSSNSTPWATWSASTRSTATLPLA